MMLYRRLAPQVRALGAGSLTVVAIMAAVMGPQSARADLIRVPADYPTIQEAIDAAQSNDEILVARGRYDETIDLLGKEVWLHSEEGPNWTTIDAGRKPRAVVTCANGETARTIIEGFTITGALDAPVAGGVLVNNSGLTIRSCWITENDGAMGGGIVARSPDLRIVDCLLQDNTGYAGAIRVAGVAELVGVNVTSNGDKESWTGGVHAEPNCILTLVDCDFTSNDGFVVGGLTAGEEPGEVYAFDCRFIGNTVLDGTAGVNAGRGVSYFFNCEFTGNPGVAASRIRYVESCSFSGNRVGLSEADDVIDCLFENNQSSGLWKATSVSNCRFINNQESGLILFGRPFFRVIDCVFEGNRGETGGGIAIWSGRAGQTFIIDGCDFVANSAAVVGGGVGVRRLPVEDRIDIVNCRFIDNVAGSNRSGDTRGGGGVGLIESSAETTIVNSLFVGNEAPAGAGAYLNESEGNFINATFSDNLALDGAAGIEATGGGATRVTNSILWNDGQNEIVVSSGAEIDVNYSDVQGGYSGISNLDTDPLFVDPAGGLYQLRGASPCIDAGDNLAVPDDIERDLSNGSRFLGSFVDVGAYETPTFARFVIKAPAPALVEIENAIDVGGAGPGDMVYAVYGFTPGFTAAPGCDDGGFQIAEARLIGSQPADEHGFARFTSLVPAAALGRQVFVQAVRVDDFIFKQCYFSNVAARTFE